MKVRFTQIKAKAKNNLIPIYCRVTIHGQRWQFATGIHVKPNQFKPRKQYITNDTVANEKLSAIKTKIELTFAKLYINCEPTIKDLKQAMKPKRDSLMPLLEKFLQKKLASTQNKDTKKTYNAYYDNLTAFSPIRKMTVKELDQITVNKLAKFLIEKRNIKSSVYQKRTIQFLGAALKDSFAHGLIKHNPFPQFVLPKASFTRRTPLSEAEIKLLLSPTGTARLQKIQRIAKVQLYTGLAYCDLMRLSKEWIESHQGNLFIVGERQKTKTDFCIPLLAKIEKQMRLANFEVPRISNQKYNQYLKELAERKGINRAITSHDLRVTFGQIMLNEGYTLETVARMLGHNKVSTTLKHYAKISKERVIKEFVGKVG